MTVTIVGSQLGDEGKGGIVDVFGEAADVVARYQGGDNAGHTVVRGGDEYKLSLVPSGAVRGKVGVLGNGCVVNPSTLFEEIDDNQVRIDGAYDHYAKTLQSALDGYVDCVLAAGPDAEAFEQYAGVLEAQAMSDPSINSEQFRRALDDLEDRRGQ